MKVGGIVKNISGNFTDFEDPDGNSIYLWEVNQEVVPESELAHSGAATPK